MDRALVTGITGQDGSYLAEHLVTLGYDVHGVVRRRSQIARHRIDSVLEGTGLEGKAQGRVTLHDADLEDVTTLRRIINSIRPDEVYHLAGQSHVGLSFEIPESTCDFTAMGTLRLLEILRDCDPTPKFLHTSSSEIFGHPNQQPQNEQTPSRPITPYGTAKSFATDMVRIYRDSFGLFACNAICFNHESPRRGETFVTRKITRAAARIKRGMQSRLVLGNLDGSRDWGYAPDYVRAFHKMLQIDQPMDLVLATGKTHTVRDWLESSFRHVDLDWQDYVDVDAKLVRKADPCRLVGDASLAEKTIGWGPSVSFETMVEEMVDHDMEHA